MALNQCSPVRRAGFSGGNCPPPITKIPTLIGWDFFARNASVGAVSRFGPLSRLFPKSPRTLVSCKTSALVDNYRRKHLAAGTDLDRDRLGRRRQARFLVGFDIDPPLDHSATEFQKLGPDALAAPARKAGIATMPSSDELFLVEVRRPSGPLPYELAGVHEGAVPLTCQVNSRRSYSGRSFSS